MKKLENRQKNWFYKLMYDKGILYFLISFLIPAVIMLLAFKKEEFHPFGDNQMLVVDLWHQYFPFFRVVREKLITGGSFLYSWQNGMGTNFLSLISYYAASPLNWISVFFSEENARDALMYILIAKIGFSGAFFSCFLRYTFKRKDFSICIFSVMYALCSYMMGYYWNVMWFDTIALFPLVMMGVAAIVREGKWKTFTFSLALSLIANYYIGYFTCIFTVFMFAAAIIVSWGGFKKFFGRLWIMIRSSVLGIALGGFILLPAYYGLQLTYSANNLFPEEVTFYESWTDIFANMLSYSAPATKEGLPNFACGMLAIILMGVFLFAAGIKIREKAAAVLMLALIAVSCNMNILNYIWHGFHFTNMIPYRFAFIFSFVLIGAAYRAYDIILKNGIKIYQLIAMLVFPWAVFYLNYITADPEEVTSVKDFLNTEAINKSLIITGAFLLIFVAIKIFPFTKPKARNTVLSLCIGAAVVTECYSNAVLGVETVGNSDYISYLSNNDDVQEMLDLADEQDDSPFYRTEISKTWTLNDSSLYGYYGISQFSSAANQSITRFIMKLGLYGSEAGNRYYYRISTPVVNSILGLHYIINKDGQYNSEEMALSEAGSSNNVYLYKNNYPLSLGYMVNSSILEIVNKSYINPFEYQNELLKYFTGIEKDCFTPQPVALASYDGVMITKSDYGTYTFTKEEPGSTDASMTYTFDGVEGGYLYGYVSNGGCSNVSVKCSGETIDSGISVEDYPIVFPMGNAQKGETSEVTIKVKDDSDNGSYKLMVYALDEEIFKEAYGKLADEQLEITKFSDTEIEGKITAQNDGVMFLSIPYEKGWSIYVDGEKAETVKVVSSMLGVNLTAGEHDIRIEYVPEGFVPGAAATGVSAVLCVGIAVFDFKRRKKRKSDNPESDDEIIETAEEVTTEAESDEVTETITENEPDEVVKTEEEAPAETETSEADIIETSEGTKSEIEPDEVDTEEENEKS